MAQQLPVELQGVPSSVLEEYIAARLKELAVPLAAELNSAATTQQIDNAISRVIYMMQPHNCDATAQLGVRFTHSCRYLGCTAGDCLLCKNNPNKTCPAGDHFDGAYADNQVLRAKCEAAVRVELFNRVTGHPVSMPGMAIMLSVVDGDSYNDADPASSRPMELLQSEEGNLLLKCEAPGKLLGSGHVVVAVQGSGARLPDVAITDKNDTFQAAGGGSASTFRLMAVVGRWEEGGAACSILEGVPPAVSAKFVVKTQRALNDYRKSEFPHYKDELTRLRYIGAITATRLKDVRATVNPKVPMASVTNVQELKGLLEYAESDRATENKLLELLNMRGKHKHKWDYLRQLLAERIVYDDNVMRAWYHPEREGQGLLYCAKQAQVSLDRPAGLLQRVIGPAGPRVQVIQVDASSGEAAKEQLRSWAQLAAQDWHSTTHQGWVLLTEPVEWVPAVPTGTAPTQLSSLPPPAGVGRAGSSAFPYSSSQPTPQQQQQYPPVAAPGMSLMHPLGSSGSMMEGQMPPVRRSGSGYALQAASSVSLPRASSTSSAGGAMAPQQPSILQQQQAASSGAGYGQPIMQVPGPQPQPYPPTGFNYSTGYMSLPLHQQHLMQQQQQRQQQQMQQLQQAQQQQQQAMGSNSPSLVPTFVPVFHSHQQLQQPQQPQQWQQQVQQGPPATGSGSWAVMQLGAPQGSSPLVSGHHSASVTVTPNEQGDDVALIHTSGSGYAGAVSPPKPLVGSVGNNAVASMPAAATSGSFAVSTQQPGPIGMALFGWEQVDSPEQMASSVQQPHRPQQGLVGSHAASLSAPGNLVSLSEAPSGSGGSSTAAKRCRASPTVELRAIMEAADGGAGAGRAAGRSLKELYHFESLGRHAPRSRTLSDVAAPSTEPLGQGMLLDADDASNWWDMLDLPEPSPGLAAGAAGAAAVGPGAGSSGHPGAQANSTGHLSAHLTAQLHISQAHSSGAGFHAPAGPAAAAAAAAAAPGLASLLIASAPANIVGLAGPAYGAVAAEGARAAAAAAAGGAGQLPPMAGAPGQQQHRGEVPARRELSRHASDSFKLMLPEHLHHGSSEVDEALRRMGVATLHH